MTVFNLKKYCAIVALVLWAAEASGSDSLLKEVETGIKKVSSSARLLKMPQDLDTKECEKGDYSFTLQLDFDGDGKPDLAFIAYMGDRKSRLKDGEPKGRMVQKFALGVLLSGKKPRAIDILQEYEGYVPNWTMLEKVNGGSVVRQVDSSNQKKIKFDGFMIIYCGKGSETYFWNPDSKKMESITTSY